MAKFEFSFEVQSSIEEVLAFHRDTSTLKQLSPPPILVRLRRIEPLAEGSVSEFTLWIGPLPIHWKAVHKDVGEHGFTDTQVSGPMQKWVHQHRFFSGGGQTRIEERIEYEHRPGPWGWLTRMLFAKPALYLLFSYRKWRTIRELKKRMEGAAK